MRFRNDYAQALSYKPDVMVIPECETLAKIKVPETSDSYWIGDNVSKGLGVFTFNNFKIDLYDKYTNEFKYILPLIVSKGNISYKLIAVWTKKVEDKKKNHINYIRQLHFALKEYESFIDDENVIIAGDLNSNLIWERTGVDKNHQDVLDQLLDKNIHSSYHHFFKEEQGKETQGTYFHYHKEDRPFHIDFCFLSKNILDRLKSVEIGKFKDWIHLSDHVPVIIDTYE
tara:strand:+ start:64 stop:747 length:684 start_codon:yes stop_codon:yes gene_type:complete